MDQGAEQLPGQDEAKLYLQGWKCDAALDYQACDAIKGEAVLLYLASS